MEVLALVNEVSGAVQLLSTTYQSVKDRYDKVCENPTLVNELGEVFAHLYTDLTSLADKCISGSVNLSQAHLHTFQSRTRKLVDFARIARDELETEKRKLHSFRHRVRRAKRTSQWLLDLKSRASEAERDLFFVTSLFSITASIAALTVSNEQPDMFCPSFDVPQNPRHVVLRFASKADMEGEQISITELTPESRLKRAVLQTSGLETIAAVGSGPGQVSSVGMNGMSGVGKSCALRGLCDDAEIRQSFSDGIYFVVLGMDASEEAVVRQLSRIVKESGGLRCSKEVAGEVDIDGAVGVAKKWFKSRRILLLIDDVWERSDAGRNVVARLTRVVDSGSGSRVVFTTRDARMAITSETVEFSVRNRADSRDILLRAAGLEGAEVGGFEGLVEDLLRLCGGLPMALSVAGQAIKMRYRISGEVTWEEAWREYLVVLGKNRTRLVRESLAGYEYENLWFAYETSLSMIDKQKMRQLGFSCRMQFSELYRGLAVIQRQGCIPLHVLCVLWKTSEYEAYEILHVMVGSSLAERKNVVVNGRMVAGVSLHDLQLDFVQAKCKEYGEEEKWHRELLNSWLLEEECGNGETTLRRGEWSQGSIFADDYIRGNVCRHLLCAGLDKELLGLLLKPEWTAKKLCVGEFLSLEEDFNIFLQHLREKEDLAPSDRKASRASDARSLNTIVGAARLCAPHVSVNAREVHFQLRGRLAGVAKESETLTAFASEIEEHAERPWVRAVTACLQEPDGALEAVAFCNGLVRGVRMGDDYESMSVYVCGIDYRNGNMFFCRVVNGQMEKEVWLNNLDEEGDENRERDLRDAMLSRSYQGSIDKVAPASGAVGSSRKETASITCVCRSPDGKYAVTGHEDGTVKRWDARSGESLGEVMRGHGGKIRCVAWSGDGDRFVSGDDDAVRIWKAETGEVVGDAALGQVPPIRCVASSADGSRLASGSLDGTVRVWNAKTGKAVGDALTGPWGSVLCLACSGDGSLVASGGLDGTVRIWNAETGEVVADVRKAHGGLVECVALSVDGSRVASGGDDGFVKIWNAETGDAVGDALEGHGDWVRDVAWSADGSRVVSAGDDCTVRVWNAEICESRGDLRSVHSDFVSCVAWSTDGSRVASGGRDRTIRIWDAETGEAVGGAFEGHRSLVTCVMWSPDGSRVASGGVDKTVRIWNADTTKAIGDALEGHHSYISCVAWSADGKRVASGGWDRTVRIWNVETGESVGAALRGPPLHVLGHDLGPVSCLAWSRDGSRVASGGLDQTVRIWNVETGKGVGAALVGHEASISCVEWSPDGEKLTSMGIDGAVITWDVVMMTRLEREDDGWKSSKMICTERTIKYIAEEDNMVLATLREKPDCTAFSPDGRKIALGWRNGRVDVLELME